MSVNEFTKYPISSAPGGVVASPPLAAHGVGVTLGGSEILRDVSCELRPGELLGIVGPNGSGKTTLIRALAGVLDVSAGRVTLDDNDLTGVGAGDRARRIAYMPQSAGRHPFTVLETVLMGRYPHLGRFAQERHQTFQPVFMPKIKKL